MKYEFRLQTNSRAELEKVAALLHRVWPEGHRFNLPYLEWLYRDNPNGQAIGYNAIYGEEVAAHYAVIPFQAEIEGEHKNAALVLDAAVDERHRGRSLLSPFHKLAKMTHQRAAELGVDHLVGVANASSTPGFLRHLGFSLVTPLDVRFCLTPPRPNGAVIDWQWRRNWNAADLSWRLANPNGHYWLAASGDFSCVAGSTKYPGVRAVLKVETDPVLRRQIEAQLTRRATLPPLLWFGKCPGLKSSASIAVPKRLRPSPFNFIFRDLTARRTHLAPERVHFEAADFDVM